MSDDPLAGVEFQRKWETLHLNWQKNYMAPLSYRRFLHDCKSTGFGSVPNINRCGVFRIKRLPDYVIETMKEAIVYFDSKLKGFALPDSV